MHAGRQETIDCGIEQSRRTILLLSPEYLTDEWPRQELLTAQWEMLAQRHCIIPVILSSISHLTDVDPVLKNIMKAVPCLVWPGPDSDNKQKEKFWKRLALLMPKFSKPYDDGGQHGQQGSRAGRSCLEMLKAFKAYGVCRTRKRRYSINRGTIETPL